jgi:ferrous iron transport protein A
MTTLNTLKLGQTATIIEFTDEFLSRKFIEMGCIPGEKVKLENIAPFGDPIAIEVAGYLLSMRKHEASTVVVKINPENNVANCDV